MLCVGMVLGSCGVVCVSFVDRAFEPVMGSYFIW
jgi:hypothetical protein